MIPELSEEIDRRIEHAEQRIKFWVVTGILANLAILVSATLPTVFYLGQLDSRLSTYTSIKNPQPIAAKENGANS
jgi:hypothetical protein